jgi:pimeloyl-ACP methyl ester carboxylesterase
MAANQPRTGEMRTPDGRRLAYCDSGAEDAVPIVAHHGTPGSRLDRHPEDAARLAELGLRMVSYDRPGYGASDPQPGRTVVDAADDVAALADHLGIDRFAVVGTSGGGPHALACSARLGRRISRVGVVVGVGPSDDPDFDFLQGMDQLNLDEFAAARESEEALAAYLQPFVERAQTDPEGLLDEIAAHLPPSDQEVFRRPAHRAVALESLVESVRQGSRGWADDDRAFATGWGFALAEAACETRLWQGELDVLVPRAHCAYLAERLPNARFELIPGAGHALADHRHDILAWLGGR